MTEEEQPCKAAPRPIANCDMEAWVKARISVSWRMLDALEQTPIVGADKPMALAALHGLLNATCVEVIKALGMEPSYVNLYRIPEHYDENEKKADES